jgi:hypothetical protein
MEMCGVLVEFGDHGRCQPFAPADAVQSIGADLG